jgi:hypothetical protein
MKIILDTNYGDSALWYESPKFRLGAILKVVVTLKLFAITIDFLSFVEVQCTPRLFVEFTAFDFSNWRVL